MMPIYTHADLEGFNKALDNDSNDWAMRAVMADWFEDHDTPNVAACLRWQVTKQKRPYLLIAHEHRHIWFPSCDERPGDPESDLPDDFYILLRDYYLGDRSIYYRTRREAEEALWRAFPLWWEGWGKHD